MRFWVRRKIRAGFIIEAMKITCKQMLGFYQATRNEYVETIRMHGVIGNDSSGDKIIYALYVMYLEDLKSNQQKRFLLSLFAQKFSKIMTYRTYVHALDLSFPFYASDHFHCIHF